jgi:hypothetical protein
MFDKLYGWPSRWWNRVLDTVDPEWRAIEDASHLLNMRNLEVGPIVAALRLLPAPFLHYTRLPD